MPQTRQRLQQLLRLRRAKLLARRGGRNRDDRRMRREQRRRRRRRVRYNDSATTTTTVVVCELRVTVRGSVTIQHAKEDNGKDAVRHLLETRTSVRIRQAFFALYDDGIKDVVPVSDASFDHDGTARTVVSTIGSRCDRRVLVIVLLRIINRNIASTYVCNNNN